MKTPEDEAFDDLAKRQGAWGGGFPAKRAMAVDKLQEPLSEWAGIKAILDEYGLQAIDFVADFKEALTQPAQEPVALMRPSEEGYDSAFRDHSTVMGCTGNPWTGWIPLYTTPPKRPWVGLTDGEIYTAYIEAANQTLRPQDERIALAFAQVIEAKLKEKNNGT
jgi:hypothetical protein